MAAENHDRFALQLGIYAKALGRLKEMLERNEDDAVRDSVILRFVFTFEMAWKATFYFLAMRGERLEKNAWAVLNEAFTAQLIDDAGLWDKLREYRNVIGHEYDEHQAVEIAAFVRRQGLALFEHLYATLLAELKRRP